MIHTDVSRLHRGKAAFHSGLAAEDAVARHYRSKGYRQLANRWRGTGGEIDLVFELDDCLIFVEVKKSATFAGAALRVSNAQKSRIFAAATEYAGRLPSGQLTPMRFDVALLDGTGRIEVLENALFTD